MTFAQRFPLRYVLMVKVDEITPAARQALSVVTRALSAALHGVAMLHRTDTPHLWLSTFTTCEIIQTLVDACVLQLEHGAR